ncbi:ring finger domain-containing protein [Ditylenchus destructor]|nr:ring finger domain-containing protein [Ditylenchus destructor]
MGHSSNSTPNEICKHMYRGAEIKCVVGSIVDSALGAIAVSCDPAYSLNVGVGRVVKNAAGSGFSHNLNNAKRVQSGPVLVVDACGGLRCRKVILVPLRNAHRRNMHELYSQIFEKAILDGLDSVAIAALGTGAYGLSFYDAANFVKVAIQARQNFGCLKVIQFMDLSNNSMNVFASAITSLGSSAVPSTSTTRSISPDSSSSSSTSTASSSSSAQSSTISTSASTSSVSDVAETSPPKKAHLDLSSAKNSFYKNLSVDDLKKMYANNDSQEKSHPCSICLSELVPEPTSDSPAGCDELVQLTLCEHIFHKDCLEAAFNVRKQCPNCMKWYSAAIGNQPKGSTMTVRKIAGTVPGHPEARGWHEIMYHVPKGVQKKDHPRPGVPFKSDTRVAFLPDSVEGTVVLRMLQLAFEQRLIFTIGDSVTTGKKNVPIWNVHHKTSMRGGPQNYGYPDETYFDRAKQELNSLGIYKEMLD